MNWAKGETQLLNYAASPQEQVTVLEDRIAGQTQQFKQYITDVQVCTENSDYRQRCSDPCTPTTIGISVSDLSFPNYLT